MQRKRGGPYVQISTSTYSNLFTACSYSRLRAYERDGGFPTHVNVSSATIVVGKTSVIAKTSG